MPDIVLFWMSLPLQASERSADSGRRTVYLVIGQDHFYRMSFDLYTEAISDILRRLGFRVVFVGDQNKTDTFPAGDESSIWFFYGMHPRLPAKLFGEDPPCGTKVYFNFEILPYKVDACESTFDVVDRPVLVRQTGLRGCKKALNHWKWVKSERINSGWADMVFDYSPLNTMFMRKFGVDAYWCPSGYHDAYVLPVETKFRSNDHITFLGARKRYNPRRHIILDKIEKMTERRVISMNHRTGSRKFNPGGRNSIAEHYVSVSIGQSDRFGTYPDLRMQVLGANRCTTVIEQTDYTPLVDGEVIECKKKRLWHECRRALADHSYGDRLHHFMKTSYRFDRHLERTMQMAGLV